MAKPECLDLVPQSDIPISELPICTRYPKEYEYQSVSIMQCCKSMAWRGARAVKIGFTSFTCFTSATLGRYSTNLFSKATRPKTTRSKSRCPSPKGILKPFSFDDIRFDYLGTGDLTNPGGTAFPPIPVLVTCNKHPAKALVGILCCLAERLPEDYVGIPEGILKRRREAREAWHQTLRDSGVFQNDSLVKTPPSLSTTAIPKDSKKVHFPPNLPIPIPNPDYRPRHANPRHRSKGFCLKHWINTGEIYFPALAHSIRQELRILDPGLVGFNGYLKEEKIREVFWEVEAGVIFADISGRDGEEGRRRAEDWWESGGVGTRKGKREGTANLKTGGGSKKKKRKKKKARRSWPAVIRSERKIHFEGAGAK